MQECFLLQHGAALLMYENGGNGGGEAVVDWPNDDYLFPEGRSRPSNFYTFLHIWTFSLDI